MLFSSLREGPAELALGADASGTATLAWLNEVPNSTARRIEALERPSTRGWRGPVRVIRSKIEPNRIALSVASDDRAALAFTTETGVGIPKDEGVQLVLRGSHGGWFRSSALPRDGLDSSPQVAMLAGDEALVAWVHEPPRGGESVQAVLVGLRGKAIGPIQTLASHQRKPELHLAGDPRGDLVLVWDPRGRSGPLVAATRNPGARFGTPVQISPGHDSEVSVAVDTRGDATVLFTHLLANDVEVEDSNQGLSPTGAQRTVVQDATRPAASAWRSPVAIPSPTEMSSLSPLIVASPTSDEVLAAWTSAPQRAVFGEFANGPWPPELARSYASTRVGTDPWGTPLPVSLANFRPPAIALDDHGDATAVWVSGKGVEESQYTP